MPYSVGNKGFMFNEVVRDSFQTDLILRLDLRNEVGDDSET